MGCFGPFPATNCIHSASSANSFPLHPPAQKHVSLLALHLEETIASPGQRTLLPQIKASLKSKASWLWKSIILLCHGNGPAGQVLRRKRDSHSNVTQLLRCLVPVPQLLSRQKFGTGILRAWKPEPTCHEEPCKHQPEHTRRTCLILAGAEDTNRRFNPPSAAFSGA